MSESPQDIEKRLEEADKFLEILSEAEFPARASRSVQARWLKKLDEKADIGASMLYGEDEREAHAQRAISAERAIAILRRYETELVKTQIEGPVWTIAKTVGNFYGVGIVRGVLNIISHWREIWESKDFWFEMMKRLIVMTSIATIKKNLKAAAAVRDDFVGVAKAAAWPQRGGTRHVRRKRSRKWA